MVIPSEVVVWSLFLSWGMEARRVVAVFWYLELSQILGPVQTGFLLTRHDLILFLLLFPEVQCILLSSLKSANIEFTKEASIKPLPYLSF